MTDRHCAYVVVLEHDVHEDDGRAILDAISMIRGVIEVRPVVSDVISHVAEMRIKRELTIKLVDLLK